MSPRIRAIIAAAATAEPTATLTVHLRHLVCAIEWSNEHHAKTGERLVIDTTEAEVVLEAVATASSGDVMELISVLNEALDLAESHATGDAAERVATLRGTVDAASAQLIAERATSADQIEGRILRADDTEALPRCATPDCGAAAFAPHTRCLSCASAMAEDARDRKADR
jgi:hypothetical protein